MKVKFTIEEVVAKPFEADINLTSGAVFNKESVIEQAQKEYDCFLLNGGELSGDQIETNWFVLCDRCGQEIDGDNIFVADDMPLCRSCHENLARYSQKADLLRYAGVDLEAFASMLRIDMSVFNYASKMGQYTNKMESAARIKAFEDMFDAARISYYYNFESDMYTRFTLNGKTYEI